MTDGRDRKERLYPLLSPGVFVGGLILSEVMALAQVGQPLQQMPPPVGTMQPQPAPSSEKKPAPPVGAQEKKLAPRLNCGPGWRPVGEMSCEAVKPIVQSQCLPGTNYFEGKFLVGCR
jgi:hypothetical protein